MVIAEKKQCFWKTYKKNKTQNPNSNQNLRRIQGPRMTQNPRMVWENGKAQDPRRIQKHGRVQSPRALGPRRTQRPRRILGPTILDKIFEARNPVQLDKTRTLRHLLLCSFLLLLSKFNFCKGDRVLRCISTKIWLFFNISYFPNIQTLTSFGNSWGDVYTKFFILNIKFNLLVVNRTCTKMQNPKILWLSL